jgi:F420-dependent oxidoreductase-like protein
MQLGIHFPDFTLPGGNTAIASHLRTTAVAAEEGGCTQFTVMDHWFQMEQRAPATDPMLEGYTSLGYLAAVTSSMRLGLLVTGVTYRHPGLLAKTVATLDVLSEGRAMFGIGAAWYEREHHALGVPYPALGERFERLEEAILIERQMFSDDDGPFDGTYYQLAETICSPKPIQAHVPIMIGGSGEKKTLKLVARYADACNLFASTPEEVGRKLEILRTHCDAEGRDYDSIQKTMISGGEAAADPDAFLRSMDDYAKLGIDMIVLSATTDDPAGWVTDLTERVGERLSVLRA